MNKNSELSCRELLSLAWQPAVFMCNNDNPSLSLGFTHRWGTLRFVGFHLFDGVADVL